MNMIEAVRSVLSKYATIQGRARRSEYWYWHLAIILAIMLLGLIWATTISLSAVFQNETGLVVSIILYIIMIALLIAIMIPSITVTVRRLHDINKSGWWYFISFVPYVGSIVLFIFTLFDSTPGANEYGENPKGIEAIVYKNTEQNTSN